MQIQRVSNGWGTDAPNQAGGRYQRNVEQAAEDAQKLTNGARSQHILCGLQNQYYRATYKSMGFTTDDLRRPVIGIANAWSECVPGHFNLRQVAQRVKDGIYRRWRNPS